MPWKGNVWRGTESEEWASETSGLYGSEYDQKAETLRAIGQGTRNDIADALRALTNTITFSGHRVFDVDVLADLIERGLLAGMHEQCGREAPHDAHPWMVDEGQAGEPVYHRQCDGVRI